MQRTRAQRRISEEHDAKHQLMLSYRSVYATPQGKQVIDDIVQRICAHKYPVMNANPMLIYQQATKRDVGQEILNMIEGITKEEA